MIDLNGFFCNSDKMAVFILLTGSQTTHRGCTARVTGDVFLRRREWLIDPLTQRRSQGLEPIPAASGREGTVTEHPPILHDERRSECEKSVDFILHYGKKAHRCHRHTLNSDQVLVLAQSNKQRANLLCNMFKPSLVNITNRLSVDSLQSFPLALEQRVNVQVNLTAPQSHLTKARPCLREPRRICFQPILTLVLVRGNVSAAVPPPACGELALRPAALHETLLLLE